MATNPARRPTTSLRPPPKGKVVDPERLRAFVEGATGEDDEVEAPVAPVAPAARAGASMPHTEAPRAIEAPEPERARRGRGVIHRAGGRKRIRVVVYLDPPDADAIERVALEERIRRGELIEDILRQYLRSRNR